MAIGLMVLALGKTLHGNLFLADFAAGITVATFGPAQRAAFEHFGELISEGLKLAALLVFGSLISFEFLAEISWQGWVFALVGLTIVLSILAHFSTDILVAAPSRAPTSPPNPAGQPDIRSRRASAMPLADLSLTPLALLTGFAVVLAIAGAISFRRRDLEST